MPNINKLVEKILSVKIQHHVNNLEYLFISGLLIS
jgi:hypothetical protein